MRTFLKTLFVRLSCIVRTFSNIWRKGIIAWIQRKWSLFRPSFPLSACLQTFPRNILTLSNRNIFWSRLKHRGLVCGQCHADFPAHLVSKFVFFGIINCALHPERIVDWMSTEPSFTEVLSNNSYSLAFIQFEDSQELPRFFESMELCSSSHWYHSSGRVLPRLQI